MFLEVAKIPQNSNCCFACLPLFRQVGEAVLEARLLEGVEEVCFSVVPMAEEVGDFGVKVAQGHLPLFDSVWLSLASISADFEDAVCTKAAVAPG